MLSESSCCGSQATDADAFAATIEEAPLEIVIEKERLVLALFQLGLADLEILSLSILEQKNLRQIAVELQIAEGAVKTRLSRALGRLRRHMLAAV